MEAEEAGENGLQASEFFLGRKVFHLRFIPCRYVK